MLVGARSLSELEAAEARWVTEKFAGGKIDDDASRFVLSSRVCRKVSVGQADGSKTFVYFDITAMPTK